MKQDNVIFDLIEQEHQRQLKGIELIASENFVSDQVMRAMGSYLTNKYAEGYPGHRYYGGCQVVDKVEQLAIDRLCKIYDADSTYYTVQLHAVGEDMMIIAHEKGRYRLNDSLYMERDRVMPFEWVNDSTFITDFMGYKERMVRSTTMTEERKQEIRDLVNKYPDDADAPVKHFVLSTTERQLKKQNMMFLYIIIGMAVGNTIWTYAVTLKRATTSGRKNGRNWSDGLRWSILGSAAVFTDSSISRRRSTNCACF